ncbi:hypothetical protein RD792_014093 [Penstemon davidsonii]|uniref:Uncharacterized protein n=1 Tax=Penstemon davidsonii TaxID=160366 RepID=A0ABR0CND1_9LAMI|nr:hypothetical protein RD792_014093 [Penstemon davidsonii]
MISLLNAHIESIGKAIDSGNFKEALRLSDEIFSKHPDSHYLHALKAVVLERMGRKEDALSLCIRSNKILSTLVTDEHIIPTLNALKMVFQRLGHLEMATSRFKDVSVKYPDNLEVMEGLFDCYVHEYSFVKQQQITLKLFKKTEDRRFLLWAVCSILLQSLKQLFSSVALKFYIFLFERQSKYGDALKFLSENLGSLMLIEADKLRLQGRLYARKFDYAAAASIFQRVLELCHDDWEHFLQYLGCLLEDDSILAKVTDPIRPLKYIECKKLKISQEVFDSRMSDAMNFVKKLMEESQDNSVRYPYLAQLEIERIKFLLRKGDAGKLVEDLMQYFRRFGHLTCFTADVEMFLQVLDNDKKSEFLKNLEKECEASTSAPTKALGQSLTVFKIQNLIGDVFALPVDDLENLAVRMTEMFCKNLPLSKELDLQESMYGEELLSMACNVLFQVIEFVQFKERLQRSSQYVMAKIEEPILLLKKSSNNIDEEENILESLGHGTHFLELSKEIKDKSLTFNEDLELRPWWTPTYDKNYLLGPFEGVSYCPREDLIKHTEAIVLKNIEKRSLLPRMIYLSIKSASVSVKQNIEASGLAADPKISVELKTLLERYTKVLEYPFDDAIQQLIGTYGEKCFEVFSYLYFISFFIFLFLALDKWFCKYIIMQAPSLDIIDWMNFAVFLNAWNLNSHEFNFPNMDNSGLGTWNFVNLLLKKYVMATIESAGPILSSPGNNLSILVQMVTGPLAWHGLIIQSCVRSVLPSGMKKKKKNKNGGSSEQSKCWFSNEIQNSIQSLCDTIELVAKWLREQIDKPEDEKFDAIFSSVKIDGRNNNGPGKVWKSLESSISTMKNAELGGRIKVWRSADVAHKIIKGQSNLLSQFLMICESKKKSLQALKERL